MFRVEVIVGVWIHMEDAFESMPPPGRVTTLYWRLRPPSAAARRWGLTQQQKATRHPASIRMPTVSNPPPMYIFSMP